LLGLLLDSWLVGLTSGWLSETKVACQLIWKLGYEKIVPVAELVALLW